MITKPIKKQCLNKTNSLNATLQAQSSYTSKYPLYKKTNWKLKII